MDKYIPSPVSADKLIEKYGKPLINLVIKVDDLTIEETLDYEYLEDRIITHIEWSTIDNQ